MFTDRKCIVVCYSSNGKLMHSVHGKCWHRVTTKPQGPSAVGWGAQKAEPALLVSVYRHAITSFLSVTLRG